MEPSELDEPGIVTADRFRRSAGGEEHALARQLACYRSRLVRLATCKLRRLRIDGADMDGEDAVDLAFCKLCRGRARGPARPIKTDEEFLKRMTAIATLIIRDEKKRAAASKRGGPTGGPAGGASDHEARRAGVNAHSGRRRIDLDLDLLVSPEPPVEDIVAAKLDGETFLERLPSGIHRGVFLLRKDGRSIEEVAGILGVASKTVERKLKDNERLYRNWKHNS